VEWVERNTTIKEACDREHRAVASLISEYPKLANIQVTFTELSKMKKKIEMVLGLNIEFGKQWK